MLLTVFTRATRSIARYMLRQRGCLAGWVGVCLSQLYQNGKTCLKTFSTIWKPHHSSFLRLLRRYPIPRGIPSAGALNTRGWEKLTIFEGNRRLSRKRCEIGRCSLWNVNRKSWVPDWHNLRWLWVTPNPGFKVLRYSTYKSNISNKVTNEH